MTQKFTPRMSKLEEEIAKLQSQLASAQMTNMELRHDAIHLARECLAWRYLEDLLTSGDQKRRRENEGRAWQIAYEAVDNTDKKRSLLEYYKEFQIVDSDKFEGREQLRRGGRPRKS